MCDFCDRIYPDKDTRYIVFGQGKYSNMNFDDKPFITIDEDGCYDINVNPGDPYEIGIIIDIKYCPYCGRNLAESEAYCSVLERRMTNQEAISILQEIKVYSVKKFDALQLAIKALEQEPNL